MKIEQIYTQCLAHAAYYIESDGEAAIFDPLREPEPYLQRVNRDNAKLKFVFETHFHADFVSGHLDLAEKTGAVIVYGPTAKPSFKALIAIDYEVFMVGKCKIQAIHTPGHTMESTCYLVFNENNEAVYLISGDTLFIGDVGRPDLVRHVIKEYTQEMLAGLLYDSLRNKIMHLPDHLIIYPNHGAGSACGKKMSDEKFDTLGHQKKVNYALQADLSREDFIKMILEGLTAPPAYFPENVKMNIGGYQSFDKLMLSSFNSLNADNFEILSEQSGVLILDVREAEEFSKGFIPGSLQIGIAGNFAQWVGEIITNLKQELILVCPVGKEKETITRLARVGYEEVKGYLEGGFESWIKAGKRVVSIKRISAMEYAKLNNQFNKVFDVRKNSEFSSSHLPNAISVPLNELRNHLSDFPKEEMFYLHCAGGYRSMIAASILYQNGWTNFSEIRDGFSGLKQAGIKVTDYIQPLTHL